ncbi:signal peptidase II [Chelativorans sp. M5D2P16]|uniref:signal peptidase II n=1 Tax=Chelativorans sp. M5D2P16 TaxID=3095678 RepID=UPI002ACA4130|nr:signal peptidase II [Chelativorans sp. M5D2P16]MDZ5697191.1 signal peptidase II [Chelativorans sp. M5D2P16]
MKLRKLVPYGAVVLLAVVLDQAIKFVVEARLPLHQGIDLLPFLALLHSRNTGVAFSMFSGVGGLWLSLAVLGVIAFIAVLAFRTEATQLFARVGFALIIGGALGNLIDRALRGFVVDYVYFHTPFWSFAIFNLADAFITVGAGLVILDEVLAWRRGRKAEE